MTKPNDDKEQAPLWEYVPAGEFQLPQDTVTETVKRGFTGFWRRLRPDAPSDQDEAISRGELETLPESELSRLVPHVDWRDCGDALAERLLPYIEASEKANLIFTITGPPHAGVAENLECFAAAHDWRVIQAPEPSRIFDADLSWLDAFKADGRPWILPRLDKCYFRDAQGLGLLRTLFATLQRDACGPGLIGCGSWARAYLRHVVPGLVQNAYVAQALDHERLGHWLQALSAGFGAAPEFLEQDSGIEVFADTGPRNGLFMRHLAAYSRGNPGVARSLWRMALRSQPYGIENRGEMDAVSEAQAITDYPDLLGRKVWILPWKFLQHPASKAAFDYEQRLILHTVLLHDGVEEAYLPRLLPLSEPVIADALKRLEQVELLVRHDGEWRVCAAGYPEARRLLKDAGYLVDEF